MNWDAIGAIGEAFGAIALFLVLVQVRHTREEVRRSVTNSRLGLALQRAAVHVDNERLTALYVRGFDALGGAQHPFVNALVEQAGMTREEANILMWNEVAWFLYRVQVIAQVEHLPTDERTDFDNATRTHFRLNPIGGLWYAHSKATVTARAAVRYIDNLLAQPG